MDTIFSEFKIVENYHKEYLSLINYYQNTNRVGSFIKYYNLDLNNNVEISYDKFTHTNHKWSLYDYTPVFSMTPVANTMTNDNMLKGQMIDGNLTIGLYSIKEPKMDDLICFYEPVQSNEVYRVSAVRLQINSIYSNPAVTHYELDLETAPISYKELNQLPINKHYIYDLFSEENKEYEEYKNYLIKLDQIKEILNQIKIYYNYNLDLYVSNNYIPIITNEIIFFSKKYFNSKYKRIFEEIKSPFGYWDKFKTYYNNLQEININESFFKVIDKTNNIIIDYELKNESDLDNLILLSKSLFNLIISI